MKHFMASKLDFNPFGLHSDTGLYIVYKCQTAPILSINRVRKSDIFMQKYLMILYTMRDGYLGNFDRYLLISISAHKERKRFVFDLNTSTN